MFNTLNKVMFRIQLHILGTKSRVVDNQIYDTMCYMILHCSDHLPVQYKSLLTAEIYCDSEACVDITLCCIESHHLFIVVDKTHTQREREKERERERERGRGRERERERERKKTKRLLEGLSTQLGCFPMILIRT